MRREDLVSLVWSPNTCYSRLIEGVPNGVEVDMKTETWTFHGTAIAIGGEQRFISAFNGHPIGVYDRTNISHLEAMKRAIEWVKERLKPTSLDD